MCKPYSQDLRERVSDGRFGRCAYKAVPLFRVSVSYIYRAPGRWRATGDTTACNKTGGGTKRNLMRTSRPFAQALLSIPDSTLEEGWRGLQPNVKRLLTTLGPLMSRSLTSVASWYQSPLSTVGRRRSPPCYARPTEGTWPRDAVDDP